MIQSLSTISSHRGLGFIAKEVSLPMADIGIDVDMGNPAKRPCPGGGAEGSAATAGGQGPGGGTGSSVGGAGLEARLQALESSLSKINVTVGSGEYTATANDACMRGLVVLEREVASLKHAIEESYKLRYPNPLCDSMKAEKAVWVENCRAAKGKGIQVGDCYHYAFLGLIKAIVQDSTLDADKRKWLWSTFLGLCHKLDEVNKVDYTRLEETFTLCSTCSSKIAKGEVAYLNWTPGPLFTESQAGRDALSFVREAILKHGVRQKNAAPPAPNFADMKKSLIERKEWGKGKGKGSD